MTHSPRRLNSSVARYPASSSAHQVGMKGTVGWQLSPPSLPWSRFPSTSRCVAGGAWTDRRGTRATKQRRVADGARCRRRSSLEVVWCNAENGAGAGPAKVLVFVSASHGEIAGVMRTDFKYTDVV